MSVGLSALWRRVKLKQTSWLREMGETQNNSKVLSGDTSFLRDALSVVDVKAIDDEEILQMIEALKSMYMNTQAFEVRLDLEVNGRPQRALYLSRMLFLMRAFTELLSSG